MRYSTVPNQIDPMWGITLTPSDDREQHVVWWSRRDVSDNAWQTFGELIDGSACYDLQQLPKV